MNTPMACSVKLLNRRNGISDKVQVRHFIMKHVHQWKRFIRWQDLERDFKEYKKEDYLIKNTLKLNNDFYISPETVEQGKLY